VCYHKGFNAAGFGGKQHQWNLVHILSAFQLCRPLYRHKYSKLLHSIRALIGQRLFTKENEISSFFAVSASVRRRASRQCGV
jgi:hypothetical protein